MKDWLYLGAEVKAKDGKYYTVLNISENNGVQLDNYKWYCRTELTSVEIKPTKTELIDKAIDLYNGIWPKFSWESCNKNKNAIVLTINKWYDDIHNVYYTKGDISQGGTSVDPKYCEVICTIEEFEQRKKELEQMNKGWYDYENQKMLKSPPVGEIVLVKMDSGKEHKAKVLEITHNGNREIFIVRAFNGVVEGVGDLVYKDKAKPLDWDKLSKRKQAIAHAMELSPDWAKLEDIFGSLYDAGVLKLPE